ncbi:MAG: hypothetical protein B7X11_01380, partial [Acidobacteria bacterium 37-65-4]
MSHEELIAGKLAEQLNDLRSGLDSVGRQLRDALAALPVVPDEAELARSIGEALPVPEIPEPVPAPLPVPAAPAAALNNALLYRVEAIEFAKSQSEILEALLQGLQDFSQRAALFVLREDTLQGWSGFGFEGNVKTWKSGLNEDPILRTVASSRSRMLLDGAMPAFIPSGQTVKRSMISPLLLKGKVSALLYADSGEDGKLDHYSADILVKAASLVIDIFPLRQKRDPLPPTLENQSIVLPGAVVGIPAEKPEEDVLFEDSGTLATAEEEMGESPSSQTIVADIPPEAASYSAPRAEIYEVADVVEEVEPVALETPPPMEATAPETPREEAIPQGEEKVHEDAQRFARLLVQEIALYHPREVEQGKRNKNLYALLR